MSGTTSYEDWPKEWPTESKPQGSEQKRHRYKQPRIAHVNHLLSDLALTVAARFTKLPLRTFPKVSICPDYILDEIVGGSTLAPNAVYIFEQAPMKGMSPYEAICMKDSFVATATENSLLMVIFDCLIQAWMRQHNFEPTGNLTNDYERISFLVKVFIGIPSNVSIS